MRFSRAYFLKNKVFCLLAPPKQMSFLTISNENIFPKTHGTKLGIQNSPWLAGYLVLSYIEMLLSIVDHFFSFFLLVNKLYVGGCLSVAYFEM